MAVDTAGSVTRRGGSLWSDQRFRAIAVQVIVVVALVAFVAYIVHNTAINLEKRGIATGFGFLDVPAGFDIATSLIPYNATMTHGRVFFVGLFNTMLVAILGIVLATIIGFVVGVLRLSPNWLINRMAYVYVEALRNVPLLLQILFWWGVFLGLPSVRQALSIGDVAFLSNRGLQLPSPIFEPGFSAIPIALVIGIVAAFLVGRWAHKRQEATGQQFPVFLTGLGLIIGLPLLAAVVTGFPLSFEIPEQKGFNFVGGFIVTPEFTALWIALSRLYRRLYRGERALGYSGGQPWPDRGCLRAGPEAELDHAAHHRAAGAAGHRAAADQPVSQLDEELVAGDRRRLSGSRRGVRQYIAQSDRAGDRNHRHYDGRVPVPEPGHFGLHELVQQTHCPGGALSHV